MNTGNITNDTKGLDLAYSSRIPIVEDFSCILGDFSIEGSGHKHLKTYAGIAQDLCRKWAKTEIKGSGKTQNWGHNYRTFFFDISLGKGNGSFRNVAESFLTHCISGKILHYGWMILLLLTHNVFGSPLIEMPVEVGQMWMAPDPICANLADGIYPDVSQACRIFVVCASETRVATFWCVRGYVFSSATGRCEPPDKVTCVALNRHETSRFQVNGSRSSEVQDFQANGVHPDYRNGCTSFHYMQDGKRTGFRCSPSSSFDWRRNSCKQSSDVSCEALTCDDKKDGFYPDVHNYCKRYLRCRFGNATEHVCPPGQLFGVRDKKCVRAHTARCPVPEASQCLGLPDGYYPDYNRGCKAFELCLNGQLKSFNCPTGTTFNKRTLTCKSSLECSRPQRDKCKNRPNGAYPEFSAGCKDFFVCLDEMLIKEGSCPLGKLLNPTNGICEPSSIVNCSPIVDLSCTGLKDGVYPDYATGCSAFYLCQYEKRVSTTFCTGNDLFDIATGSCLPPGFVTCEKPSGISFTPKLLDSYDCNGRVGLYPEFSSQCRKFVICAYGHKGVYECPEGTWFDIETNKCQTNISSCSSPSVISTFQCLPSDEGVYVSSTCSQWHECRKGIGFVTECPLGHKYNLNLGKCVKPDTVCEEQIRVRKSVTGTSEINVFEDENSIFDCTNRENAVYDDQICRVFHICAEKKLFSFSCPSSMSFHLETWQCQPLGEDSKCPVEDLPSPEIRTHIFDCSDVPDGMYSDYQAQCKRYFVCEGGTSVLVYCPEGQRFSSVKMVCDRADRVNCLHSTTEDIDWKDLIYHVEGSTSETQENFRINKNSSPALGTHEIYNLNENTSSFGERTLRNSSQEPNSVLEKNSQIKKSYMPKGSSSGSTRSSNFHNSDVTTEQTFHFLSPCSNGDTGFFADYESNCKKFHICFRTIRKTYSCPSVLLFNPETKNCDLPANVQCSRPELLNNTRIQCSSLSYSYEPDFSTGCRKYTGCLNDILYRFACPTGKLFDFESRSCVAAALVNCTQRNDIIRRFEGILSTTSRLPSTRHVHGNRRRTFDCAHKADGFYPDYGRHCHVFYRCVRGKKFSHYCKQGLLFNPASGICDFEENVICHSGNSTRHTETSPLKTRIL